MCLDIDKSTRRLIAKEDITVYKFLTLTNLNKHLFGEIKDKAKFKAVINGHDVEGEISMKDNDICQFHLLHNNYACDGSIPFNMRGYKCGWYFDKQVDSLIINDKELITNNFDDKLFCTPYQNAIVEIGKTYESKLKREISSTYYSVEIGLHSFENIRDARFYISSYKRLVKCVIPKGSAYYVGKYSGTTSYASTKLKYIEIIN